MALRQRLTAAADFLEHLSFQGMTSGRQRMAAHARHHAQRPLLAHPKAACRTVNGALQHIIQGLAFHTAQFTLESFKQITVSVVTVFEQRTTGCSSCFFHGNCFFVILIPKSCLPIWACRFSMAKLTMDDRRNTTEMAFFWKNKFHHNDKHGHLLDSQVDGHANTLSQKSRVYVIYLKKKTNIT